MSISHITHNGNNGDNGQDKAAQAKAGFDKVAENCAAGCDDSNIPVGERQARAMGYSWNNWQDYDSNGNTVALNSGAYHITPTNNLADGNPHITPTNNLAMGTPHITPTNNLAAGNPHITPTNSYGAETVQIAENTDGSSFFNALGQQVTEAVMAGKL